MARNPFAKSCVSNKGMRPIYVILAALLFLGVALAQAPTAPVLNPRGVVNAFSQQPAPTYAASGGIIWITGLNLGPPEGAKTEGPNLPKELGSVKVLVNNQPIPLISVSPGKIVAQVPWDAADTPQGNLLQLVVESAGVRSRNAARFFVRREEPAIRAKGDTGFGEVDGVLQGNTLKISVIGLGPVDPPVETGAPGPPDLASKPKGDLRVYVGGIPAHVDAGLSSDRAGVFDVLIDVPPGAKPGDIIQLYLNNRMANRVTFGSLSAPETQFLKAPDGAELRAITGADLRGTFVFASAARDSNGCYPSYLFDFERKSVSPLDGCLTAANRNSATPFVPLPEGTAVSAFVGPAEGDSQQGVSSKVRVWNPALDAPLDVALPAPASSLAGVGGDTVVALIPGTPPTAVGIDISTGETRSASALAGGAGQGLPNQPVAATALSLDLGDGLTHVLTQRISIGAGRSVVAVGDDAEKPKKAKLAFLDARNAVTDIEDFPEDFVPLVPPTPPAPAAQPGQQPAAPQALARIRTAQYYDTATRTLYILSRKPDDSAHGYVAFTFAQETRKKAIPFPENSFVPACTANVPIFTLELSRTLVVLGSNKPEGEFKAVCEALGFIVMGLNNQEPRAIPLPGAGFINASSAFDLNDYLIGTNVGNARQPADTIDVLDGVNLTVTRLQLPSGVASFTGLRPIGTTGLLIAMAQRTAGGDQGLVVFDLEEAATRHLPVPEGFASVQLVDIMPATRKVVARGIKTGNAGAQYLIYDLLTMDLTLVPNPEGVVWVGGVPAQAPQPGAPGAGAGGGGAGGGAAGGGAGGAGGTIAQPQAAPSIYQDPNPKTNTLAAMCFDADRKPVGVMLVRIP